ncbi:MAG: type II secretion system protein [Patescibacteria group bacterium]
MKTHMNARGVTLIETLVWIVLFTFVMLAIMQSVLYFYRTNNYVIQESTAVSSVQRGIDSMVRVIRESAYSDTGAYPVVSIATSSVTFYANTDTDTSVEKVRYYISGTTLYLGVVNPTGDPAVYTGAEATTTISDNIKNISQSVNLFTYYDQNGALISDYTKVGDVRFVTLNLVADIDPNRAPTLITLRSSAALRNLIY